MEKTLLPTDEEIAKYAKEFDNSVSSMAECIWMPQGVTEGAKWMRKKAEAFTLGFADWLKYESVCFPEHKDKSIEELLEIYKKEKTL